jgi:hypothetical protein
VLFTAEFRIDHGRIDHIVPMQRPRTRLGDGRSVDVADAEGRDVGNVPFGICKSEVLVELQAKRRARNHLRFAFSMSIRAATCG